MTEFSSKELRIITGIAAKNLYNYRIRGAIIQGENKTYQFSNPINKAFIETHGIPVELKNILESKKKKPVKKILKTKPKLKKPIVLSKKKAPDKKKKIILKEESEPQELSELAKVTLEQKQLAIKKAKTEMKLKELELKKMEGSLISIDDVINISKSYSNSLNKELLQSIRTFIKDICSRNGINSGKAGEYSLMAADKINSSNALAIQTLLKNYNK